MDSDFEGIYFDGKSSRPYKAQVRLHPGQLQIVYQEPGQPVPVTVYWQPARIRPEIITPGGLSQWSYGDYPAQVLEVASPAFAEQLRQQYAQEPLNRSLSPVPTGKIRPWFWMAALILIALVPVIYFWVIPGVADYAARLLPTHTEEYLGNQLYRQIIEGEKKDQDRSAFLQGFYRQLAVESTYSFRLTVIRKTEPNAFALPGGNLVVHTGIIKLLQQPAELAALLGHETGHVHMRHTTRGLFRSLAGYIFVSLIFGDVSGVTAILIENAGALRRLEYSRHLETEADAYSFRLLKQNRISPQGMIALFNRLKESEKGPSSEFLSTHPLLDSRIAHIRKLIRREPYPVQPNDSLNYFWRKLKAAD